MCIKHKLIYMVCWIVWIPYDITIAMIYNDIWFKADIASYLNRLLPSINDSFC